MTQYNLEEFGEVSIKRGLETGVFMVFGTTNKEKYEAFVKEVKEDVCFVEEKIINEEQIEELLKNSKKQVFVVEGNPYLSNKFRIHARKYDKNIILHIPFSKELDQRELCMSDYKEIGTVETDAGVIVSSTSKEFTVNKNRFGAISNGHVPIDSIHDIFQIKKDAE